MKDYCDRDYKLIKSKSYLVWGLVMAALALIILIISLLTFADNSNIALAATGFGAAAAWTVASSMCLRVYYKDNHVEIKEKAKGIAEAVENAVKK